MRTNLEPLSFSPQQLSSLSNQRRAWLSIASLSGIFACLLSIVLIWYYVYRVRHYRCCSYVLSFFNFWTQNLWARMWKHEPLGNLNPNFLVQVSCRFTSRDLGQQLRRTKKTPLLFLSPALSPLTLVLFFFRFICVS